MNTSLIASAKDLGIAIVAVLVIGYICYKILEQLKENNKDYRSFVLENNHQKTSMIEKHTEVMVEVKNVLEAHTKILEKISDKI